MVLLIIAFVVLQEANIEKSEQSYQKMGKRISGAKVIVIDKISLTSLEDFYIQHKVYSRALSTFP